MTIADALKDIEAVNRALRACEDDPTWTDAMNEMSHDANATFVRALDRLVLIEDRWRLEISGAF